MAWVYFAFVQLVCLSAMVIGWVLLIPLSLLSLWVIRPSKEYPYEVLCWRGGWLTYLWGNEEDGIDGTRGFEKDPSGYWQYLQQPWIDRTRRWPMWLRVYHWSAWRNSANNLRFIFRWNGGPFYRREIKDFYIQFGWNAEGFPVLSAGRIPFA